MRWAYTWRALLLATVLVLALLLFTSGCPRGNLTIRDGGGGEGGGAATRPAPFGMSWGGFLLGLALAMFLLSMFVATKNELAAKILAGLAVVAASLGFVATTEKEISWGLRVLVVLGLVGLGVGGVLMTIRLWRHFKNLAIDGPNTPATNKLVESAKKQTNSSATASSSQSESPRSDSSA